MMMKQQRSHWKLFVLTCLGGLLLGSLLINGCGRSSNNKPPTAPDPNVPTPLPDNVLIGESLKTGATVGVYDDAVLTEQGLQFQGVWAYLQYNLGTTMAKGYIEFSASGFEPDEDPHNERNRCEFEPTFLTMWSANESFMYETATHLYELYNRGCVAGHPAANTFQIRMIVNRDWNIGERHKVDWERGRTYRFRIEWGNGLAIVKRDGEQVTAVGYFGEFAPANQIIQIGSNSTAPVSHRHKQGSPNLLISDVVIGRIP